MVSIPREASLRLTRFDGADVFSWKVLRDESSAHYDAGKFNHLKVRVEKDRFLCYVNDHLVYESKDKEFRAGKVGLAKFRDTEATFKQFQIAAKIAPTTISNDKRQTLEKLIDALPSLERSQTENIKPLLSEAASSRELIIRRAERLEKEAQDLRRIAQDVHVQSLVKKMRTLVADKTQFDLLQACLLVAKLNEEDLDIAAYRDILSRMAADVKSKLPKNADASKRLAALDTFLFAEQGFHGSRFDYYHRANSFLNRVLDDRVGLPITLCVLYIELAAQLDLKMEGVGLPGHFVVRYVPKKGQPQLIDVFNEAKHLTRKQAAELVWRTSGQLLRDEHLTPLNSRLVVQRVLRNLIGLAQEQDDRSELLRYLEMYLVLDADSVAERGMRAMARFETGRRQAAIRDLDWFLEKQPPGLELRRIHQLRQYMEKQDPPTRR